MQEYTQSTHNQHKNPYPTCMSLRPTYSNLCSHTFQQHKHPHLHLHTAPSPLPASTSCVVCCTPNTCRPLHCRQAAHTAPRTNPSQPPMSSVCTCTLVLPRRDRPSCSWGLPDMSSRARCGRAWRAPARAASCSCLCVRGVEGWGHAAACVCVWER